MCYGINGILWCQYTTVFSKTFRYNLYLWVWCVHRYSVRGYRCGKVCVTHGVTHATPYLWSFQETSIDIEVPSGSKHVPSRKFSIPGLHYHKITTMIKEAYESPLALKFHYTPFKLYHTCPANGSEAEKDEHFYSEMYNLDALINKHDKVQHMPTDDPNCKQEKVISTVMLWSDTTHLTSFGTAKMWPIYMLFGKLSKYIHAQPNSGATTHLAYILPFPDSLQDQIKAFHKKWGTQKSEILTHCH
jgi:hypothetical protein